MGCEPEELSWQTAQTLQITSQTLLNETMKQLSIYSYSPSPVFLLYYKLWNHFISYLPDASSFLIDNLDQASYGEQLELN